MSYAMRMSWKHTILALMMLAFLAAFLWGPLFALSPVHPGYRQVQFSRADVLYPDSAAFDPAYREVDRYVATAESFHELKCSKKIKVVVCRNWNDCIRFAAPFLMGQRPLAVTVSTGTVIFVTPRAAGWADTGGLLRHELSHAVLNQNRTLLSVATALGFRGRGGSCGWDGDDRTRAALAELARRRVPVACEDARPMVLLCRWTAGGLAVELYSMGLFLGPTNRPPRQGQLSKLRAGVLLRPAGVPEHFLRRLRNGPSDCCRRLSGGGTIGTSSGPATDCVLNS
jgi:hypothetical protein